MTDLGMLHYFLGLYVHQSSNEITIFQQKYSLELLQHFGMVNYKPTLTHFHSNVTLSSSCTTHRVDPTLYRQIIGSLLYLSHTRPNISSTVSLVSRFSQDPQQSNQKAVKHVLIYTQGNSIFCIHYTVGSPKLIGFTDSNQAKSVDDHISTSSSFFYLGYAIIAWTCKKHSTIALSMTKVEYRAEILKSQEVIWLRQLLLEFGIQQDQPTCFWYDNHNEIHISRNIMEHQKTKQIEIHMHFINQLIQDGVLSLEYIPSEEEITYIFTNSLSSLRFLKL